MNLKKRFTENDLQRIKAAVKDAERKISGEIVPVIVEKSGYYSIANYKASLVGASLSFIVMIILDRYIVHDVDMILYYDPLFIFSVVILGGIIGSMVPNFFPFIMHALINQKHLNHATRQRAENAFLEEEVFNTRHRTGIMIFISFFEREVIVMADRGISKVVDQKLWDKIVADLVANIKADRIVDGLEGAIKRCGEILLEKGFVITDDDVNELRDDLRIE
jgi:putative membrane protein